MTVVGIVSSVYGPSVLGRALRGGKRSCAMHSVAVERIEEFGSVPVEGAVTKEYDKAQLCGLGSGVQPERFFEGTVCGVGGGVLHLDGEFARHAIVMDVPGFAYTKFEGLPVMDRYAKGALIKGDVPAAYSYLGLFRAGFQRRVARLLGTAPLLADVCALLRLAGRVTSKLDLIERGGQLVIELGADDVSVKGVVHKAIGYLGNDPMATLRPARSDDGYCYTKVSGVGDEMAVSALGTNPLARELVKYLVRNVNLDMPSDVALERVGESMLHCVRSLDSVTCGQLVKELCDHARGNPAICVGASNSDKVKCNRCGFMVVPLDHGQRCQVQRVRRPESELLGDALHRFDVNMVVVLTAKLPRQYTVVAQPYIDAAGQRAYLESTGVKLHGDYSTHTWGNEFESRYHGDFRLKYIAWLWQQLGNEPLVLDEVKPFLDLWGGTVALVGGEYGVAREVTFRTSINWWVIVYLMAFVVAVAVMAAHL